MGDIRQNPDPSSVEEVEWAKTAARRRRPWGEWLLGLGLLLIVAALAGSNWWQGETEHTAYLAGDRAATAQQWDEARTQFLAAGGYPNAQARAATAAVKIAERDKQYALALAALARHDGIAALQALDAVDQVEAGYGDTTLLRSEANDQIYRSALAGMVAQRRQANPPGLYYRTADDWVWLTGSDAASSPHNYGNPDDIVYDVPAAGAPLPATATIPASGGSAGSAPAPRRLMAAHLAGGSLSFTPVALDGQASVYWGLQGGWSYKYGCRESIPPQLSSYYCADGMVYSAAGTQVTTTVQLPGPNWIIADLAHDGSKMLVADKSAEDTAAPLMSLYITAPDGSRPRLLYQDTSWIGRAAFTQDGRYVLATLGSDARAGETSYKAVLLDASGVAAPQILTTAHYSTAEAPGGLDFVLLAGAGAGKVAIAQYSAQQTMLQIVDLGSTHKEAQPLWASRVFRPPMMVTRQADGGLLLCGRVENVSVTLDPLNTNTGQCVLLAATGEATTFDLPVITHYGIGYAWPRQGAVFYPIAVPQGGAAGLSVLRIHPTRTAAGPPAPTVILQLPLGAGETLNLVAGADLLAYARQGQLHVRTYDGSTDLLLEEGVDTLYDVRGEANTTILF